MSFATRSPSRLAAALAVLWSFGAVVGGCGSSETEGAGCPAAVTAELDGVRCQVEALEAEVAALADELAQACAVLAEALGSSAPPVSAPITKQELDAVCGAATAAEQALPPHSSEVTLGSCAPDAQALADCQAGCASAPACSDCCQLAAPYLLACTPPSVVVTSGSPPLEPTTEATLEQGLAAIAAASQRAQALQAPYEDLITQVEQASKHVQAEPGCQSAHGGEMDDLLERAYDVPCVIVTCVSAFDR